MSQLVNTWRVAVRELAARWLLIPAAIVLGTLAMLTIRSIASGTGDADRWINGTWVATLAISVIVGLSLVGNELANGRLSFYFARPFAPSAIFGGKLVGGVILALVIQVAVIGLVGLGLLSIAWTGSALAAHGLVAVVGERVLGTFACVILGMAIGIVLQSRTRWLIVDAGCVALVGIVATWVVLHVTRAMRSGHHGDPNIPPGYDAQVALLQIGALAVAVAGLAAATARALANGRTDSERAHATLSTTLWPIVVPAAAVMLAATLAWF